MVLAQLYKSKDFLKTLGYTSRIDNPESELPEIVYGNVGASLLPGQIAPKTIANQMSDRAELSYRVVRPCYHMVLSVPQQDTLDSRAWHDLTRDFLEGMGLRDRQAVAYLHEDTTYPDGTERPHVHIVANRVGRNGKAIDTSWDYYRAQSVLRNLEKAYDLTPEPFSWEVDRRGDPSSQVQRLERLEQSGFQPDPTVRQQLQEEIDEAISSQSQWSDVVNTLEQKGIDVRLGERGWSLARDGIAFSGSQLGSIYTAEAVQNALEVSMSNQEERDESASAIKQVSNQLQQPPDENRDRPATAEPQNVGSQMRQRLRKSLENDNKQRAIDRDGLDRGTSNLSNLGNQALKLAQGVDGTTMVGATLIGGSMALKAGLAIKEALDNHQDRKRQERVAKISDRIEKIDNRAESLEKQVSAADLPAPTVVSTGPQDKSQPDSSKDPVAGVLFGADSKVGDLEESLGLERGDSSLGIDPEKPFDEQLDQIEKSLESLESRLDRVADRCLDVLGRESTASRESPTAREEQSPEKPLSGSDLAHSIVNYAQSRAAAYGISANDPIETRSLGTIQVDNDGRISIGDDSYGTKFEATWDDDQRQWQIEIDDLSDDERTALSDLPQTPEEYSSQANGKATVQALRTLAQREFDKPDGGSIRWEARQGNSYQVSIDNQSDGSQSVVGHNIDSDEEVLRATISPNGAMKIDQFNLERETVDDLVNVADRQRRQREHPANAILKKQTPTEDLAL